MLVHPYRKPIVVPEQVQAINANRSAELALNGPRDFSGEKRDPFPVRSFSCHTTADVRLRV